MEENFLCWSQIKHRSKPIKNIIVWELTGQSSEHYSLSKEKRKKALCIKMKGQKRISFEKMSLVSIYNFKYEKKTSGFILYQFTTPLS